VSEEKLEIILTKDPEDFSSCASMMAVNDPWITLGLDYSQCLKAFEGSCKEVYVSKLEKDIAGFVILQVCGTLSGYIQTICISEKCRGMGYGTRLLQFCEERILKYSPNIFICVSSFNTRALKLYLDYGFKMVGEMDNFVKEGYSELLLRKTVGPRLGYLQHNLNKSM
jgi:[ribosomal protein S18]-alanine N-acetyltransferase